MSRIALIIFCIIIPSAVFAHDPPAAHLARFGYGSGPGIAAGVYQLLDGSNTPDQSNAVAFDLPEEGLYQQIRFQGRLHMQSGGDGGAILFLNTAEYGRRGPAPFVKNWTEPNLKKTLAVGIDIHNPATEDFFDKWGNYQGLPEREISLHWAGQEIVKRVAPVEFRDLLRDWEITIDHVTGGANITVRIDGEPVYDHYFVPGMQPYESRLAIGAGSHGDGAGEFEVQDIRLDKGGPAPEPRSPKHIKIFNHVRTGNSKKSVTREVMLPPRNFAFDRIILTLQIHDARPGWDPWDRNGSLYIVNPDGTRHDILPFITSFGTPFMRQVDVTHFRPWLADRTIFELATTTDPEKNYTFMISASLDFYHGRPELEAYRIIELWSGTAKYKSDANHFSDFFAPQYIEIDGSAKAAKLFITTTGHSQVGEFTPSRRTVVFIPDKNSKTPTEKRFENYLWKKDNYLNSTRPQRGTWKLSRAGWAPGDVVSPWWIDLTPYIIPGKTAELRYEPEPYDFSDIPRDKQPTPEEVNQAVQLVRSYLILYRTASDVITVPPLQVLEVMKDSNASKGDIRPGDYLESYDSRRPESIEELRQFIKEAENAGKEDIEVVIYRGSEKLELKLGPGKMGVLLEEQ